MRIAVCHLESLTCLPAVNALFSDLGDQIGLVILSRRFSSKHGGLLRQFIDNTKRSGLKLTFWLGFDIIAAQVVSPISRLLTVILGRRPSLQPVRVLAERYGAKIIESADINDAETIAAVRGFAPDAVVVMNFDQILRPAFISGIQARIGTLNVHPSLLPALRGPCPVFWALAEGSRQCGVSLHVIEDAEIDAGPIVCQSAAPLNPAVSVAETTSMLFREGAALVKAALDRAEAGAYRHQDQPSVKASYRSFPKREEVAEASRLGIRLWSMLFVLRVIAASIGLARI
jgi:methionyl-tRNA formyltransferase